MASLLWVALSMYTNTRGSLVYTWRLFHHPTVVKKGFKLNAIPYEYVSKGPFVVFECVQSR